MRSPPQTPDAQFVKEPSAPRSPTLLNGAGPAIEVPSSPSDQQVTKRIKTDAVARLLGHLRHVRADMSRLQQELDAVTKELEELQY